MNIDLENIRIKDLAGLICRLLKENGIEVVLVGGACVSIYSVNKYLSHDLDFVMHASVKEVESMSCRALGKFPVLISRSISQQRYSVQRLDIVEVALPSRLNIRRNCPDPAFLSLSRRQYVSRETRPGKILQPIYR